MNIMYYLNKDSYEIYDFNTVFNFFNSLDKIIIYYHSIFLIEHISMQLIISLKFILQTLAMKHLYIIKLSFL